MFIRGTGSGWEDMKQKEVPRDKEPRTKKKSFQSSEKLPKKTKAVRGKGLVRKPTARKRDGRSDGKKNKGRK